MDLIFRENKQRFVALQEVMSHLHAAELDTFDDVPGEKQICDNDRNSREEHRHGGLTHCIVQDKNGRKGFLCILRNK